MVECATVCVKSVVILGFFHHSLHMTLSSKGGFMSGSFSLGSNLPKNVPNHYSKLYPRKDAQDSVKVFGTFLGSLEPKYLNIL